MMEDDLTLLCSCSYLHHSVRFSFFPWGPRDKEGGFEAYVCVSLDYERRWWRRLRVAARYFFRRTCGYGDVSEIMIRDQDLPKLRAWMERAEREADKRRHDHGEVDLDKLAHLAMKRAELEKLKGRIPKEQWDALSRQVDDLAAEFEKRQS